MMSISSSSKIVSPLPHFSSTSVGGGNITQKKLPLKILDPRSEALPAAISISEDSNITIGKIRISGCKIQGNKLDGIRLEEPYRRSVEIEGCWLIENQQNGIALYN